MWLLPFDVVWDFWLEETQEYLLIDFSLILLLVLVLTFLLVFFREEFFVSIIPNKSSSSSSGGPCLRGEPMFKRTSWGFTFE